MTSFKGTPGPWEMAMPFYDIYQFGTPNYICQASKSQGEKREANARLIAAAPELLEALMLMVDTFSNPEAGEVDRILVNTDARNAIAKALGQ